MQCPRCRRRVDSKSRRCTWCSIDVPPGQHMLEESGVVVPFRPADTEGDRSSPPRLATLGDRFIATLFDTSILLAACILINGWAFMRWGVAAGAQFRVTAASILVGGSLSLLLCFLYLWLLEACFGSTVGKAIVGIGVVNNSARSSVAASAIRNLYRIVDGLGFYLVGTLVASCSKFRRRIGDIYAETYVVEGSLSEITRGLAVLAWLALLSGSVWALPRVLAQPRPLTLPRHFAQVVIEAGRAENSIYLKLSNHRIELSMINVVAEETPAVVQQSDANAPDKKDANALHDLPQHPALAYPTASE